jgi:hypothetical protein
MPGRSNGCGESLNGHQFIGFEVNVLPARSLSINLDTYQWANDVYHEPLLSSLIPTDILREHDVLTNLKILCIHRSILI